MAIFFGNDADFGDRVARQLYDAALDAPGPAGLARMEAVFPRQKGSRPDSLRAGGMATLLHEADATRYRSMRFPPWYFVMAKLFGLRYALVMAPGAYDAPIECPVDEVVRCATQILTV